MRAIIALIVLLWAVPAQAQIAVCKGPYALCAASTCKPTGGTITVAVQGGGTATFPEVTCTCPVLHGEALADLSGGNMQGSCAAPVGGGVWSLFAPRAHFPQETNGFKREPELTKAVFQVCPAALGQGARTANCFSMACTSAKAQDGAKLATCRCPMGESVTGTPVPAATAFGTAAGQGNPAACGQHPVSLPFTQ